VNSEVAPNAWETSHHHILTRANRVVRESDANRHSQGETNRSVLTSVLTLSVLDFTGSVPPGF